MLEDLEMEMNPQPQKLIYTDVFANLDRDDYSQQITAAELYLAEFGDDQDQIASDQLEVLDEILGFGEEEVASIYTGIAYQLDEDGLLDPYKPRVFVDQELTFCGTGYHDVKEKWRILFEFRDDSSEKMHSYAAPFDGMVQLGVMENPSEKYDIIETLMQHEKLSKILLCDPGFYMTGANEQMEVLKSVAISCHNKLLETVDPEGVSVESPIFYVHPDNKDEDKFTVTCVDQAYENFEDRIAVTGDMIGIIYLEVCLDTGRPFASASDFFVGGAPCMVVRNETEGTTSYIPIDTIESIEKNN